MAGPRAGGGRGEVAGDRPPRLGRPGPRAVGRAAHRRVRARSQSAAGGAELDHVSRRGPLALALVAFLGLGASGCSLPQAFVPPPALRPLHRGCVRTPGRVRAGPRGGSPAPGGRAGHGQVPCHHRLRVHRLRQDPTCARLENEAYLAELSATPERPENRTTWARIGWRAGSSLSETTPIRV